MPKERKRPVTLTRQELRPVRLKLCVFDGHFGLFGSFRATE